MDSTKHIQILYGLIAVLFVAMGGLAYATFKGKSSAPLTQLPSSSTVSGAAPANLSNIQVGGGASASTTSFTGAITQLSASSMAFRDAQSGATETVAINGSTKFQLAGKLTDPATYQKEMAAYNAQVTQLMQDPIKNKAALAALTLPQAQAVTPAVISDFKVGDQVVIATTGSTGSYTAVSITKNSGQ